MRVWQFRRSSCRFENYLSFSEKDKKNIFFLLKYQSCILLVKLIVAFVFVFVFFICILYSCGTQVAHVFYQLNLISLMKPALPRIPKRFLSMTLAMWPIIWQGSGPCSWGIRICRISRLFPCLGRLLMRLFWNVFICENYLFYTDSITMLFSQFKDVRCG